MFIWRFKLLYTIAIACFVALTIASCSKETSKTMQQANSESQLSFVIAEQTGTLIENAKNLRASNTGAGMSYGQEAQKQHHFIEDGAFRVTTSIIRESSSSSLAKPFVKNKLNSRMSSTQTTPSTSVMKDGTKYRVVLYDNSTSPSTFVSSTLGTAGQELLIDVEKKKNYDWAVFSYNDENDPGEDKDVVNANTGLRDLLYAKGTTGRIPGENGDGHIIVPIKVVLQHKLANVSIQVTTKDYPARITDIGASFGRGTMFCKRPLDLRTGEFTYENTQIQMEPAIAFHSLDNDSTMEANYFTSKFEAISDFRVILNKLGIRTASNEAKSLSSPKPYDWNINPSQGERVIAKIDIQPIRDISGDKFKILSVGADHYTLSPPIPVNSIAGFSGSWYAINSAKNFGPTGTYPTTNFSWQIVYKLTFSSVTEDLSQYKLIFIGNGPSPLAADAPVAQRLINYIEAGGTVIWSAGTPNNAAYKAIWGRFAGPQATGVTNTSTRVSSFNQHPILNGVFGDARGKKLGVYLGVEDGVTNIGNATEVMAVNSQNPNIAVVWKAKDYDFYFIGSHGMQKYQYFNNPTYPFLLSARPDYVPEIRTWNGQPDVANSIMLMNIFAKTLDKVLGGGK